MEHRVWKFHVSETWAGPYKAYENWITTPFYAREGCILFAFNIAIPFSYRVVQIVQLPITFPPFSAGEEMINLNGA